jgi:hypothetical protein
MAGGADSKIAALPAIARLDAYDSARGADADRRVKLSTKFAVEGALTLFGLVAASAIVCTTPTLLGLNWKMPGRTSEKSAVFSRVLVTE